MNKFNSQICTTKEQSQRLLELGLKPETADMKHFFDNRNDYSFFHHWECIPYEWDKEFLVDSENIPSWSLHRLIELGGFNVECKGIFWRVMGTYFNESCNKIYDTIIDSIETLITENLFNKEYLIEGL